MAITSRTATVSNTASATTITGTVPTGTVAGDLMIVVYGMTGTSAQFTGPGGSWTQIMAPTSASTTTCAAYYLFAVGGDAGPVGTSAAAASRQTALMQTYIGVDSGTPIDVTAVVTTFATGNTGSLYPLNGVTVATSGARLISGIAGEFATGVWTQPATMALLANHVSGTGRGAALADESPATGATGTRQWADNASATLAHIGFVGALRPSAAVAAGPPGVLRRFPLGV